jgi:hypothetical protein
MRFLYFIGHTMIVCLIVLSMLDIATRIALPVNPRLDANFSSTYYARSAETITSNDTVFLGDSVLWGYRLKPEDIASELLKKDGIASKNLAFEGGSVANTYATLAYLIHQHIRPKKIFFNINVKVFNPADSAYNKLHPSIERLAWNLLSPTQKNRLQPTLENTLNTKFDGTVSEIWFTYATRSDIREQIFGDVDAINFLSSWIHRFSGEAQRADAAHKPTSSIFLGTYDLSTLDETNVEVEFLKDLISAIRREHIDAVAMLTPTNHHLLHHYIDVPEYDEQLRFLSEMLENSGIQVLNYDRSFQANEFIDNDHLTLKGNQHLAALLKENLH